MEVVVAKTAGFCFGVTNAVKKAEEILEKNNHVYCLGELANNAQVMKRLEQKGLQVEEDIDKIPNHETVIIRAHGVAEKVYEIAKEKSIELIDLTCPKVLQIHRIVKEYSNEDYFVGIIGVKEHPESIGTKGHTKKGFIIEEECDIFEFLREIENENQVLLVVQTTFSVEKFEKYAEIIKQKISEQKELKIVNTICPATYERQKEAKEISEQVDFVIVVGGKKSSNTKKLYEIAKEHCKNAVAVETKEEIDMEEVKKNNKVGVLAGASTPQDVIFDLVMLIS